jgi:Ser/Thr protein kinase RdoA (MazF antagonist)
MTRLEVTPAFAEDVAQRLYGLRVQAERLPGEYDDNFRLTCADGTRLVLKIMHPQRDAALIDMQIQALAHLARTAPALLTSRIQRRTDRASFGRVSDARGAERIVWLLDYIDGTPYAEAVPPCASLRASLGAYVGQLDSALASFTHPAAHRELKWDSARAPWILPRLGEIRDRDRRALVEHFMRLYAQVVTPALPLVRHGVIHGDANECNTLTRTSRDGTPEVVAVIDFGDMHHGTTLSGLAIATAYAIFGAPDPLQAAAEIVAGYHAKAPIPEAELPLLLPLIAARLCVSVVNSAIRAALSPDDPYLTVSEMPAWEALHALARHTPEDALLRFRLACGLPAVPHAPRRT